MSNENAPATEIEPELQSSMEREGVEGTVRFIHELDDDGQLDAFERAQRLFGPRGTAPVDFDDYISLIHIGMEDAMRHSRRGGGDASKDLANRMSFNMSADLAACWPDDERVRDKRHFEEGLKAAEDCIRWRNELNKPDERKSIAWWAKGMHLFSLDRLDDSLDAFRTATTLSGVAPDADPQSSMTFSQLLNIGYCALAQIAQGHESGRPTLERVRAAYREQFADPAKKEDAEFGIDQLTTVEKRM
ncbi:MAG: hypothetical protein H7X80_03235 [bacterium]|nr:hypothetical protein [Candidatus Kapabacteria bacterium]